MLSDMWRDLISASESDYISENYLIEITPNFHAEKISLISGEYGPFKPNKIIKIPLWLAVKYRNNNQCKIIIPSIYENSYLNGVLESEKENKTSLFDLPPNFFEISNILFNNAEDDFDDIKKTRCFVADIKTIRQNKINNMLKNIKNDDLYLKLNGLTSMELEQIRPLLKSIFPMRLKILGQVNIDFTHHLLFNAIPKDNKNGQENDVGEGENNENKINDENKDEEEDEKDKSEEKDNGENKDDENVNNNNIEGFN
jgi:GINS complex subunit 2